MTRSSKSDLVLDGNVVKLRLRAERLHTKCLVHVDWVRFTVRVKNVPLPSVDDLFPLPEPVELGVPLTEWAGKRLVRPEGKAPPEYVSPYGRRERLVKSLRLLSDPDFSVSVQAKDLAERACEALGSDFEVEPEQRKGHDFYRFRWSIVRKSTRVECGWVGYLSSGESPRQRAQSSTIHCNLYGTACTFADVGFAERIAALVRDTDAVLTRVDLALDFFNGLRGGMERVRDDYAAGLMDVYGKRPKANMVGGWPMDRERSFYFGSKEGGKQTNMYEKGHQLFGMKSVDPWIRGELRYGNKARVLDVEMLERPDDFFAGASDWHAALLREAEAELADEIQREEAVAPAAVPVRPKLSAQTILAEVQRNARWLRDTAAPSIALAFQYLGADAFMQLVEHQKLPGRLQKFTTTEVASAYERAFKAIKGSGFGRLGLDPYQQAATA
jgi:phage replication initiation protein